MAHGDILHLEFSVWAWKQAMIQLAQKGKGGGKPVKGRPVSPPTGVSFSGADVQGCVSSQTLGSLIW